MNVSNIQEIVSKILMPKSSPKSTKVPLLWSPHAFVHSICSSLLSFAFVCVLYVLNCMDFMRLTKIIVYMFGDNYLIPSISEQISFMRHNNVKLNYGDNCLPCTASMWISGIELKKFELTVSVNHFGCKRTIFLKTRNGCPEIFQLCKIHYL